MTLIYCVILCLLLMARSSQLQCVKESLNDADFSINVTTRIKVEYGDCIHIPYEFTFPTNKVKVPYKKIWFSRDPQNSKREEVVQDFESGTRGTLRIHDLPRGEFEYGLKLEWECNQTYIFPKRIQISVSALTRKPTIRSVPMEEGKDAILNCLPPHLGCSRKPNIYWKQSKDDVTSLVLNDYDYLPRLKPYYIRSDMLQIIPKADDHNTNITCVVEYDHETVETTITLTVKVSPRILNSSQCMVDKTLLVCVCISQGNPLPPITWPLASLTDFSVTSSSSVQTVKSTITLSAADYHKTSVKCISSNEMGTAEMEIPLQHRDYNYIENPSLIHELDSNPRSNAVHVWIIAGLSLCLNLVLLAILIICKYMRDKSLQKELDEENTYTSINQSYVEQPYSVISPRIRQNA